tara:strand:+ start:13079 stop:13498 length:420 start_codon:yes stop_codon:yes gene_type:complete
MNRLSDLSQSILLATVSTLLSFCVAWSVAFKLSWTYSNVFDGTSVSANDCFITLLIVLSVVFQAIGKLVLYIFRLGKPINTKPLIGWKKNFGIKPKCKIVNVVLSTGTVLWLKETSSLDWSLDAEVPITEYMPKYSTEE